MPIVSAPHDAVQARLGARRELRALHADVRAAAVEELPARRAAARLAVAASRVVRARRRLDEARGARGARDGVRELGAHGLGEADVADDAVAEEARRAPVRAVDELVDEHDVAGRDAALERADGRDREHALGAELLERVDVRAVVDLRRQEAVPAAVARQEEQRARRRGGPRRRAPTARRRASRRRARARPRGLRARRGRCLPERRESWFA